MLDPDISENHAVKYCSQYTVIIMLKYYPININLGSKNLKIVHFIKSKLNTVMFVHKIVTVKTESTLFHKTKTYGTLIYINKNTA
jgi:hypothetical protein